MPNRRWRYTLLVAWLGFAAACGPPDPAKLLLDARQAAAAGEFRTAEIHLKNLLQQQSGNAPARQLLGEVLLASGDFAGAEQTLRRALELGADAAGIQLSLVRALLGQAKSADALKQIETGPALAGTDQATLLILKGAAEHSLGSVDGAESAYRAALQIDPRSTAARTELAAVLLASNRGDQGSALIAAVLADDPKFAPALLLRGSVEAGSKQYDAAEASFREVMTTATGQGRQRSPEYASALAQLIDLELSQHKLDDAAANADALLALDSHGAVARYLKARVEVEQANLDGAESRLEAVITDFPTYWPAHALLGAINLRQDQLGQALMYLRNAVTNNPADAASRLSLAELYIRQDDLPAAKALFADSAASAGDGVFLALAGRMSQQAGRPEAAAEFFQQSEQRQPEDFQQLIGLSSVYVAAGEFERAIRVIEGAAIDRPQSAQLKDYLLALVQLRQGDPKSADASAARLAEALPKMAWPLNLRGTIALLSRDPAAANSFFTRALEVEPKSVPALTNLARVAVVQNDRAKATDYLKRAVEIDPKDPTAVVSLAELAIQGGDFEAAAKWLERAPDSPLRFRLEGDVAMGSKRFPAAADAYAKAFDAAPGADLGLRAFVAANRAGRPDADAKLTSWVAGHPNDAAAQFALGSISLSRGDRDAAIRRYEAVLTADPKNAAALNNLAWLYGERNDPRAVDYAARAHESQPKNPAIADTLGWLHVRRGDAKQGLPLLQDAAAALADRPDVRYHWAVALAETGDKAKAADTLRSILANGKDFAERADAEQRLAALDNPTK